MPESIRKLMAKNRGCSCLPLITPRGHRTSWSQALSLRKWEYSYLVYAAIKTLLSISPVLYQRLKSSSNTGNVSSMSKIIYLPLLSSLFTISLSIINAFIPLLLSLWSLTVFLSWAAEKGSFPYVALPSGLFTFPH